MRDGLDSQLLAHQSSDPKSLLSSQLLGPALGIAITGSYGGTSESPAKGFSLKLLPSWMTSDESFKVAMVQLDKPAAEVALRTQVKCEAFSPGWTPMAADVTVAITHCPYNACRNPGGRCGGRHLTDEEAAAEHGAHSP